MNSQIQLSQLRWAHWPEGRARLMQPSSNWSWSSSSFQHCTVQRWITHHGGGGYWCATLHFWVQPFPHHLTPSHFMWGQCCCYLVNTQGRKLHVGSHLAAKAILNTEQQKWVKQPFGILTKDCLLSGWFWTENTKLSLKHFNEPNLVANNFKS